MDDALIPIDAVALRKPLRPWRFPNGVVCAVKEIDAPAERVRQAAVASKSEEKYRELLKLICPTASDAEWESMTAEDYANLYTHAAQKVVAAQQIVEEMRKNADAGTVAPPTAPVTRRSSQTTRKGTSVRGSRASTAAATGTP